MRNATKIRRFVFAVSAIGLIAAVIAGTKIGSKPVAAQTVAPADVFMFQCSVIPNQPDFFALGSFHFTGSGAPGSIVINPSDCAGAMTQLLNAGYHFKSELALPNGGPTGTGATEYVFVRGGSQ
ncbi:MAG TPA: hypothetical protein VE263_03245 [Candidatus Angelobacter sp.]|nr:hypothetical protein [Candidatus Angelobacter sp.]